MGVDGLHNVYNLIGVIIAAHEFLELPYNKILPSIASFTGVSGRMEEVGKVKGKDIFVDYAHNPAGVETVKVTSYSPGLPNTTTGLRTVGSLTYCGCGEKLHCQRVSSS